MRRHELNITITSNTDLTKLNSNRLTFNKVGKDTFNVTSTLKFYPCEIHGFIRRVLRRNLKLKYIVGNCSAPTGYIFSTANQ